MKLRRAPSLAIVPAVPANRELDKAAPLVDRAAAYLEANLSPKTRKDYAHDWHMFEGWCAAHAVDAAAADDAGIAVYLAWMADQGQAPASIERAWHGIYWKLRQSRPDTYKGELCRKVLRGIRRSSPHKKLAKRSLVREDLVKLLEHCGEGPIAIRNRAILLVGFAGGFRRSELAGLNVGDLQFSEKGAQVALGRTKTDQEGKGRVVGLSRSRRERCPVAALLAWLDYLDLRIHGTERPNQPSLIKVAQPLFPAMDRWGHVFPRRITPVVVANVVKAACRGAGLPIAEYAAHSLRAGFVTQAALMHKSLEAIMRQTGHRSVEQVIGYIRHADVFTENASEGLLD